MARTKEAVVKDTKETEAVAKSLQDSVQSLTRNFIAFFAVVAGTNSLKNFAEDVTKTDTALGRLGERLGIAPQKIGAWGLAIERFGGSSQDAAAAFQSLSDKMNAVRTGNGAEFMKWISQLQQIGDTTIRLDKGIKTELIDLSTALAKAKAKGQGSLANYLLSNLVPPGMTTFLDQGPAVVAATLADTNRLTASNTQIKVNENLLRSFVSLQQTIIALGRDLETSLAPHVAHIIDKLQNWIDKNKEWLDQKNGDAVRGLADSITDFVSSPEFKSFVASISNGNNWKPFVDFVKGMAKPETWKGFESGILEIVNAFNKLFGAVNKTFDRIESFLRSPAAKFFFDPAGLGDDLRRRFNDATGVAVTPGNDPMALAQGPYANAGTSIGGNLKAAWRNRPRWMGGQGNERERHPRPGKLSGNQANNASAAIDELRKAGYNDNAIAAVIGSMQTESSFFPQAHNNIAGGHTGAWQWDAARWPKIRQWIIANGGDPNSFRWQTKAWIAEHNAKPGDAIYDNAKTEAGGAILRSNPTLDQAVHGVRLSERFGAGEEGGGARHAAEWLPRLARTAKGSESPSAGDADYRAHRGGVVPMPANMPSRVPSWAGTLAAVREAAQPIPAAYLHAAAVAGGAARIANDNRTSHSSSETNVGAIHVHTAATDARGIAHDLKPILAGNTRTAGYNSGPK